ncbi:hypothetical protein D8O27_22975 [Burkholderia mallei]|uniref:Uncharacterized protein n=2 Tax=Burkholderia mallei TaxID=13373 RepID=A0AAX1XA43_BURML|nr:hypothetical protein BMAA0103 [Burkholderia mallei ATCC 23344]AYE32339.1 hypothetical protein CNX72_35855 [Burkholderia pseudomallei]PNX05521.1 hypothetical protein CF649_05865 [Burkholderia sp. 136(2017)]PNX17916.1 hypothetical protein CF650_00630 [Burkholderia sp. 129]PNX32425.1 hypothetical protein CF647_05770 [Burkholderia sp. 117]PNX41380.1 hypothetical protein CF648_05860 [Burkholderia sp. 137]RKN92564.1 hypothetical protein D8O03_28980 [Burkholderia mallei]
MMSGAQAPCPSGPLCRARRAARGRFEVPPRESASGDRFACCFEPQSRAARACAARAPRLGRDAAST